jgi:lycopene cyclase domain-containing protein
MHITSIIASTVRKNAKRLDFFMHQRNTHLKNSSSKKKDKRPNNSLAKRMEKYLYLLIDICCILFPLIFSFQRKKNFSKKWKYLWPAILITATFFIVWDEIFTSIGVWSFNPRYLSGVYVLHLPIEEILFFICIPYACLFTYEAINYFFIKDIFQPYRHSITILLVCFLTVSGLLNIGKWYTSITFLSTSLFLTLHLVFLKADYLSRFYFAFIFILIPFFIVNGILTGTGIDEEVVRYNNEENLGLRMGTIPFEDTFYGMLLILMNITFFEGLQKRRALSTSPS